jgi:hypothetical protein
MTKEALIYFFQTSSKANLYPKFLEAPEINSQNADLVKATVFRKIGLYSTILW